MSMVGVIHCSAGAAAERFGSPAQSTGAVASRIAALYFMVGVWVLGSGAGISGNPAKSGMWRFPA